MKPQYSMKARRKKGRVTPRKNPSKLDRNGGVKPATLRESISARLADVITFPKNITGSNCGNCSAFKRYSGSSIGWCANAVVSQAVSVRQCCNFWSHSGTLRTWK